MLKRKHSYKLSRKVPCDYILVLEWWQHTFGNLLSANHICKNMNSATSGLVYAGLIVSRRNSRIERETYTRKWQLLKNAQF
jgi:hypothetical protein